MPTTLRPRRRKVIHGHDYAGGSPNTAEPARNALATPARHHLTYLTTPPKELGLIGAELAKRLTVAAEEFLTELAAHQVRDSFRQELGVLMDEEPEE